VLVRSGRLNEFLSWTFGLKQSSIEGLACAVCLALGVGAAVVVAPPGAVAEASASQSVLPSESHLFAATSTSASVVSDGWLHPSRPWLAPKDHLDGSYSPAVTSTKGKNNSKTRNGGKAGVTAGSDRGTAPVPGGAQGETLALPDGPGQRQLPEVYTPDKKVVHVGVAPASGPGNDGRESPVPPASEVKLAVAEPAIPAEVALDLDI
jgi:hypothetical protein